MSLPKRGKSIFGGKEHKGEPETSFLGEEEVKNLTKLDKLLTELNKIGTRQYLPGLEAYVDSKRSGNFNFYFFDSATASQFLVLVKKTLRKTYEDRRDELNNSHVLDVKVSEIKSGELTGSHSFSLTTAQHQMFEGAIQVLANRYPTELAGYLHAVEQEQKQRQSFFDEVRRSIEPDQAPVVSQAEIKRKS